MLWGFFGNLIFPIITGMLCGSHLYINKLTSAFCGSLVIDYEFRHNTVKVAVDSWDEWICRLLSIDNVVTKFIVNDKTDAWKTWRQFVFTVTNCLFELVNFLHNLCLSTYRHWKLANEYARISAVIIKCGIAYKVAIKTVSVI